MGCSGFGGFVVILCNAEFVFFSLLIYLRGKAFATYFKKNLFPMNEGGKKASQRNPRESYAPLRNREAFHCAHSSKSSAGGPKGLSKSPNSMRARVCVSRRRWTGAAKDRRDGHRSAACLS
jgi:hypothetical protein